MLPVKKKTTNIFESYGRKIKEVGRIRVAQIVTNNKNNCQKAGQLLEDKYDIYWTPCKSRTICPVVLCWFVCESSQVANDQWFLIINML